MKVQVRVHVGYEDDVDVQEVMVEVPSSATLGDVWRALTTQYAHLVETPILKVEVGDPDESGASPGTESTYQRSPFIRGSAMTVLSVEPEEEPDDIAFARSTSRVRASGLRPPLVDGFDFPVGKPDARGYYVAAGLAEYPYYQRFGMWHTGEDWNSTRGGDSDLGAPVYATAHGRVTVARYYTPSWGNVLLVEHNLPGGRKVWSQYAHLRDVFVQPGEIVRRGQKIGTIGKGHNNQWTAHLHFEIRLTELPANQWWWDTAQERELVLRYYAHPSNYIRSYRPGREPVGVVVDVSDPGFVRTASPYWFEADVGYRKHIFWTWAVDQETGEDCVGVWRPDLPADGQYEVLAYIPNYHATTRNATYRIAHSQGTERVTINQNEYYNEWVSLGSYPFSAQMPAAVRLSDLTGEPLTNKEEERLKIAFDAMMWIPVK